MKITKFYPVCIWAVCAVVALSAIVMNSCSSDSDYDLYQGDELKTYAAATRAGSESGTAIYEGSYVRAGRTFYFERESQGGWIFDLALQWTSGYTGNLHTPFSNIMIISCNPVGSNSRRDFGWVENWYGTYTKTFINASVCWSKDDVIVVTYKYSANTIGASSQFVYDTSRFTLDDINIFVSYDEEEDSTQTAGTNEIAL